MLKAIALGGVETGSNMAVEAESAMIIATSVFAVGKIAIPNGIKTGIMTAARAVREWITKCGPVVDKQNA